MQVTINGKNFEMEAVANLMDEEIRESLHSQLAPCTEQEFVDAYCKAHEEKFGEEFMVN